MNKVPEDHPRYLSLSIRERLAKDVDSGIVSYEGLSAHGRGEAFDYLLGEKTHSFALEAMEAAAAHMILAAKPVISVNGNAASLCPRELVDLGKKLRAPLEVNIFHYAVSRKKMIAEKLRESGAKDIRGFDEDAKIDGLESGRAKVDRKGIFSADLVFVPLEDGDRCEALIKMGKKVVTIDLNPLSRTSKSATVTIVDNIVRALPVLLNLLVDMKALPIKTLKERLDNFDNNRCLRDAMNYMSENLRRLSEETK